MSDTVFWRSASGGSCPIINGWSWRGGERWTDDGFPLNTGLVTDQPDGLGENVYSLHRTDDSFAWDADGADESHRVLCRDWIHSSPHTHKIAIRFAAYFMKAPRAAPVCQRPRPSGTLGLARDVPLCPRRTQTAVCGCTAPRVRAQGSTHSAVRSRHRQKEEFYDLRAH